MKNENKVFRSIVGALIKVFLHPRIYGNTKLKEPCILVCNHTGHVDGAVVTYVFRPLTVRGLAAKDRFEQFWFGMFLRASQCIPIDRKHASTSWIHEAMKALKEDGDLVCIYPEGRHAPHRQLLPFHAGVVMLAALADVPVVLVYNDGPARWFHTNDYMVSEPFRLPAPENGTNGDYLQQQANFLHDEMEKLMNRYIEEYGQNK